ncbi:hypothetical protein VTJ04DRAFT_9176 [Mycothermus thermophilus]|uniref:uncharacterized protein n=1 Tax=Humicola insolens TaxID=85995 RepID=UPI00374303FB
MSPASLLTAVVIAAQSPAPPSPESAGDLTLKQLGQDRSPGGRIRTLAPAAAAGRSRPRQQDNAKRPEDKNAIRR